MVPPNRRADTTKVARRVKAHRIPARSRASVRHWTAIPSVLIVFAVLALIVTSLRLDHVAAQTGKIITLGESLSPDQRTELLTFFGYNPDEDEDPLTVTTAETI